MKQRVCIWVAMATLACGVAAASEEEYLPWTEIRLVMPERKDTGKLVFTAKTDGDNYREVKIEAFGKEYSLEKADLAKIKGYPLSNLVVSHEAGYEKLGGHTVYFKLRRERTDPPKAGGIISISRGKGIALTGFAALDADK